MSDTRKEKRYVAKMMGGHAAREMYVAHSLGEWHNILCWPNHNPYPPGRRHDEYNRSYNLADPLGDHY